MAYTVHDPKAFFAAIVTRLGTSTGKNIGLAIAPANTTFPYAVVYPLGDDRNEGALNNPSEVVVWAWQVTCVSDKVAGTQWMQTKARTALHGFTPTVAGLGTTPIELSDGSGVTRDDSLQPPLFYSTDRFVAFTSA